MVVAGGSQRQTQPVESDWSHLSARSTDQRRPFGRLGLLGTGALSALLLVALGFAMATSWSVKATVPDYYGGPHNNWSGLYLQCGTLYSPHTAIHGNPGAELHVSTIQDPGYSLADWKRQPTAGQLCSAARRPIYIAESLTGLAALAMLLTAGILKSRSGQTPDAPVPNDRTTPAALDGQQQNAQDRETLHESSDSPDQPHRVRYPWLS